VVGELHFKDTPDPADPTTWRTYLWASVNQSISKEQFGAPIEVCVNDANDTGKFQGSLVKTQTPRIEDRIQQLSRNL
jgi:hypothetical protein